VNAFTRSDKSIAIGTRCRWYRVCDKRLYPIENTSNTYQVSPMDVGTRLKVEVESMEEDYPGVASAYFGPIRLDPTMRP
jgi:hypothetical protein